ncbi:hypothetical protein KBD75_01305 [Candidatus Woesebacteria bacterium]|nr:hypothetical protein [Candidatus Woesebacteria bacterium]
MSLEKNKDISLMLKLLPGQTLTTKPRSYATRINLDRRLIVSVSPIHEQVLSTRHVKLSYLSDNKEKVIYAPFNEDRLQDIQAALFIIASLSDNHVHSYGTKDLATFSTYIESAFFNSQIVGSPKLLTILG